jgi:hypothetical protein
MYGMLNFFANSLCKFSCPMDVGRSLPCLHVFNDVEKDTIIVVLNVQVWWRRIAIVAHF